MITIAIPTYKNTAEQLKRCFTSLQNLKGVDVLICVDDDSAEYNKLVKQTAYECGIAPVIIQQKNKGVFAARKNLCNSCSTSWIFFLDADDYITSEFVYFIKNFQPNNKYDLYTTQCEIVGKSNNFNFTNKEVRKCVENGNNNLMWGKFIKTAILKKTYEMLPEYPCGLFFGEEIPQTWAFSFFNKKSLNIKSICYSDEGTTAIKTITNIERWKKLLSVVYLLDWYGLPYIKQLLTERLKTVDPTIGKQAISLLRRTMNKAEIANNIFIENERNGKSVHETSLELFGNSDPLNLREVLEIDFERDCRTE
ncbi:MAG: glycosyltransferase family 2 protein [Treponema sp.]|nr:glycosyltransferase family 2 protein [Treponema sp.]